MVPKTSGPGTTALVRQREPGLSQVQFIRHTDYGIDGSGGLFDPRSALLRSSASIAKRRGNHNDHRTAHRADLTFHRTSLDSLQSNDQVTQSR